MGQSTTPDPSGSSARPFRSIGATGGPTFPVKLLETVRLAAKIMRFYRASSSDMSGAASLPPRNERTEFYPRSPYAAAKVYRYWIPKNYREA